MKQICDVLADKPLVFVAPSDTIRQTARKMTQNNIGAVAVLDDENHLTGIFTERDLMTRVVAESRDPDTLTVGEVMTKKIVVGTSKDSVSASVQKMHDVGCRHLPIVDDGKLVGMISLRDLLQVDSESSRARATFLRELVTYSADYES
ncbi:MAG TPA: CBS domain-containing protein [Thermoanaerobaculia bacterium]|nr:CBS domain-containing protein [Thermoanaerobaculia bacterium]